MVWRPAAQRSATDVEALALADSKAPPIVAHLQDDTFSINPGFLGAYMGDSAGKVP
eukprot:SAG31_NODE_817_length_11849_cov_6.737362_2_plen_56_part_00